MPKYHNIDIDYSRVALLLNIAENGLPAKHGQYIEPIYMTAIEELKAMAEDVKEQRTGKKREEGPKSITPAAGPANAFVEDTDGKIRQVEGKPIPSASNYDDLNRPKNQESDADKKVTDPAQPAPDKLMRDRPPERTNPVVANSVEDLNRRGAEGYGGTPVYPDRPRTIPSNPQRDRADPTQPTNEPVERKV